MLVTLTGVGRPGVYEVPLGTPLRHVLRNAGAHDVSGVLVGGYFGTWLTPRQAAMVTLSADDLKDDGRRARLRRDRGDRPRARARSPRWPASRAGSRASRRASAARARTASRRSRARSSTWRKAPDRNGNAEAAARRWLEMVAGRGACKLPDGAVRFVSSGFTVFAEHVAEHARHGRCRAFHAPAILPVPRPDRSWR